jgi:hypothetical protein
MKCELVQASDCRTLYVNALNKRLSLWIQFFYSWSFQQYVDCVPMVFKSLKMFVNVLWYNTRYNFLHPIVEILVDVQF